MKKNEKLDTVTEREYKVVKANEIIQKAKFDLGLLEQKTFCYAVSKIKPNDAINTEYVFQSMNIVMLVVSIVIVEKP